MTHQSNPAARIGAVIGADGAEIGDIIGVRPHPEGRVITMLVRDSGVVTGDHRPNLPVRRVPLDAARHSIAAEPPVAATGGDDLDLAEVCARYELARAAGRAADPTEGDGQLNRGRWNVLVASWQDVAALHDEVKRQRERPAAVEGDRRPPWPPRVRGAWGAWPSDLESKGQELAEWQVGYSAGDPRWSPGNDLR